MSRRLSLLAALVLAAVFAAPGHAQAPRPGTEGQPAPNSQPRPHGTRLAVDPAKVRVDDGDTVVIEWGKGDSEIVRILGIDTPETRHVEHNLPYAQDFGPEARGFALGAFGAATSVEILRAATLDPYGRTLGYLFVNGRNYSVLVVAARLAAETVGHYGDNGLPKEAAEVLAAAKAAGPVPFEPPYQFRARMRDVSAFLQQQGAAPEK
jgi:endonuclease YncB( thermonuclease family)